MIPLVFAWLAVTNDSLVRALVLDTITVSLKGEENLTTVARIHQARDHDGGARDFGMQSVTLNVPRALGCPEGTTPYSN